MGDFDKDIDERAREFISMFKKGFELGYRVFDSRGNELKTVLQVIEKLQSGDKIKICETEDEVRVYMNQKN